MWHWPCFVAVLSPSGLGLWCLPVLRDPRGGSGSLPSTPAQSLDPGSRAKGGGGQAGERQLPPCSQLRQGLRPPSALGPPGGG